MLPSDIEEWLQSNSSSGYRAHLLAHQADVSFYVTTLEIEGTELADLYFRHGAMPVRGWYELIEIDQVEEMTTYAINELGVPVGYLALTGVVGQDIVLYNRSSQAVFDVEFGQFDLLLKGELAPIATTFSGFLRWCRDRDQDD